MLSVFFELVVVNFSLKVFFVNPVDSKSIELLKVANELLHNSFPVRYVLVNTLHTRHGVGVLRVFVLSVISVIIRISFWESVLLSRLEGSTLTIYVLVHQWKYVCLCWGIGPIKVWLQLL